jgi:hypothetical protein
MIVLEAFFLPYENVDPVFEFQGPNAFGRLPDILKRASSSSAGCDRPCLCSKPPFLNGECTQWGLIMPDPKGPLLA